MHSQLKQTLASGKRQDLPWRQGMRPSTKLDLCFFAFMAVCLYFALLVEYDIDLLDLVREAAPITHEQRMAKYERRQAAMEAKIAARKGNDVRLDPVARTAPITGKPAHTTTTRKANGRMEGDGTGEGGGKSTADQKDDT